MASGKLSPRQKMINMMYLLLTALLALNVSKEVLNSFFEVNKGIERTTSNFDSKNGDTYAEFDNAGSLLQIYFKYTIAFFASSQTLQNCRLHHWSPNQQ